MKKLIILPLLFLILHLNAQSFSFQMFFSDAIGNKDTITLGYDMLATDSIDASFGEVNMIAVPLDTGLDVRITNEWANREFHFTPGTFHTKKQILFYDCHLINSVQNIDIFTKHWPVTATWDSSLFINSCRNGTVFTAIQNGGWFDTGCPSDLWYKALRGTDSVTFTSNTDGGFSNNFAYMNSAGDTVPVFWFAFADSTLISSSIHETGNTNASVKLFPNPSLNMVYLNVDPAFGAIKSIGFYDLSGQLVLTPVQTDAIDIKDLRAGIYFVKVTNRTGVSTVLKFQKL